MVEVTSRENSRPGTREIANEGGRRIGKIVEHIEAVVLAVKNQDEAVSLFEELFGFDFDHSWDIELSGQ